jgi:hypothetical protein
MDSLARYLDSFFCMVRKAKIKRGAADVLNIFRGSNDFTLTINILMQLMRRTHQNILNRSVKLNYFNIKLEETPINLENHY